MYTKSTLLIFLLTILCCCQLNAQIAAVNPSPKKDLILEVPQADLTKVLPLIKQHLKDFTEVSFEGFCDSRKLLFLKSDSQTQQQLIYMFREMGLICFVKKEISIDKAKLACDTQEEIQTSFTIE